MLRREKRRPIEDPIRHAENLLGMAFLQKAWVVPWEKRITRHTTQEFAGLGKGYKRHCGPTAITNALLTLHHRDRFLPRPVDARQIFTTVSTIGKRKGIYWNTDLFGRFGGTYDLLTRKYIRDCFAYYQVDPHLTGSPIATKKQVIRALDAGRLLYLQLIRHPIYGSHHLLCYGYTVLRSLQEGREELYLLLADGWSETTRYLRMADLGWFHFYGLG